MQTVQLHRLPLQKYGERPGTRLRRVARRDDDVRCLTALERTYRIIDSQNLRRIDRQ